MSLIEANNLRSNNSETRIIIDNVHSSALTSPPAMVRKKNSSLDSKNKNTNLIRILIQALYERDEINEATYKRAIKKLSREVSLYERRI